jgi:hypothetical protein
MEEYLLQKYRLLYLLLVKDFVAEVEKGTKWIDLQPLLAEMRRLDEYFENAEGILSGNQQRMAA